MRNDFEERVWAWCRREGILPPGVSILVAASGGADSTALLRCLHALAGGERWRLAVAHLDHALRPESADDAAFVRRQVASLGLPFFDARVEVRSLPSCAGRSPEEGARLARRSFLRRAARTFGADAVALGHTLDDQAETVLLNLTRGAGTLGLAAMPPAADIFVRPLLARSRAEILTYLDELGAPWREDPTNRDPTFLRNWFRLEVLPALEARMPGVRASFASLAAGARAEAAALERRTAVLMSRLVIDSGRDEVRLAASFPAALPDALRGRAVRQLYRGLVGSTRGLERRHVEDVLSLREGRTVCLPAGVTARREADGVYFKLTRPEPALRDWSAEVAVPGRTLVAPAGVEITATVARAPDVLRGRGLAEVWLDERFAATRLEVRAWRKGDRVRPAGLDGRKKLQDIFVDAKVPAGERRRWPVICEGLNILWVPALALAEGAAASPGARSVHLRCLRPGVPEDAARRERTDHGLQRERG
ncbi:MAG: tRNA lysidine(34) synthetase TilS [candidate division Zixibacteria bacterium]|nr:tRNA lysidine(34) synthetase TilS [candidate division Zixibacteria bacterium]